MHYVVLDNHFANPVAGKKHREIQVLQQVAVVLLFSLTIGMPRIILGAEQVVIIQATEV